MSDLKCFNCLKLSKELSVVNNRLSKVVLLAAQVTDQNKRLFEIIASKKEVDKQEELVN